MPGLPGGISSRSPFPVDHERSPWPRHVAVIMDGNGRWARRRRLPRVEGHRAGVKSAQAAMEVCRDEGIPYLTLYTFSLENWQRPREEVDELMRLLHRYLSREAPRLAENRIRFRALGRLGLLPPKVRAKVDEINATALGLTRLTLREQVSGWKAADALRFDIGEVSGPWGLRYFVESVGVGMIPRMIIASQRDRPGKRKGKRRRNARAVRLALRHLRDCPGIALDALIDGRSCEGRFLLFEVMNISLVGPNLCLATSADPTDRMFDVVVVREFERELLRECLEAEEEGAAWPHELTTIRGSRLEFASGGFPVHVDDEIYLRTSGEGRRGAPIRLAMRQGVTMLLPRAA